MGPRFTVSVHTVLRSTSGAAGFRRDTPMVTPTRTTLPAATQMMLRRRFWTLNSGRAISMLRDCASVEPESQEVYPLQTPVHRHSETSCLSAGRVRKQD